MFKLEMLQQLGKFERPFDQISTDQLNTMGSKGVRLWAIQFGPTRHHEQWGIPNRLDQGAVQRCSQGTIDDYSPGDSSYGHVSGGQPWIVHEHGTDTGHDGIDTPPFPVDHLTAARAAYPLAVTGSCRDSSIQRLGPFHGYPGSLFLESDSKGQQE